MDINKSIQEQRALKQKSVHLIENAPENIQKLNVSLGNRFVATNGPGY